MANRLKTVFQNLDNAISGNWDNLEHKHNNSYDLSSSSDNVIYTTTDKQDYERTKLEYQQNAYLDQRWRKANADLSVKAFNGLNNIKLMYRDADLMDAYPEIGAALDIVSEEACLCGETEIKLLNGEIFTINELYSAKMTNFWAYTLNENGECMPTLIDGVVCNGKKEIYNLTLDDGTVIRCTDNHKWFLSDGNWKETKDLQFGDSLMSIYDRVNNKGYEEISSTICSKFIPTHRIVAENVLREDKLNLVKNNKTKQVIVIHHKSFNKLNNDPSQLEYMYWIDHQMYHNSLNKERWDNEEYSNKMRKIFSETNKKTWEEKGDIIKEKLKLSWEERKKTQSKDYFIKVFARKGEHNGMYGVHRYGSDNPNFNSDKNHECDINEIEYLNYLKTLDRKEIRKSLRDKFNLMDKSVVSFNQKLCKKYNVTNILDVRNILIAKDIENLIETSHKPLTFKILLEDYYPHLSEYVLKGIIDKHKIDISRNSITISDLKNKLFECRNYTKNDIVDVFKMSYSELDNLLHTNGYDNYNVFKESLFNHRVVSVVKTNTFENVYDLVNSSVNHSFAVKCNNGHIISHNCVLGSSNSVVNVYSKSNRIKNVLEDLFTNRLDLQVTAPMIIRAMCKYGNQFMLLNIDNKLGVKGWRQLPVFNVERLENGVSNQYGINRVDMENESDMSTKFIWLDENNSQVPFRNWQIGHFRLLTDSIYLPYGCSYLHKARRHWRMLSLMEDMMLIYRLERSIERRVYKIYVGAIDDADVGAYIEEIANNFKRTPIIDPLTGQVDLRKNILSVDQDIFIPVRNESAPTPIDTLSAAQNLTAMDDIKFVQNKVLTGLRIPKSFLNFEEATGDGKNLALMDIRFTRTINRIQQAFLMELTKIATIHLYIMGFEDDLTNFSLSMNNPSTQAEQLEIDNIQKKIGAIRDAVADPGNGIPIMSQSRALREIMKWSDKDIKDNLEEIRLEKAIAAELEKTTQIIKKTGVFDSVDLIYGEPGAEYQDDSQGQEGEGDMGGMPGGGGGGGMPPMDSGGVDGEIDALGGVGEEDSNGMINGEEGEIPMDNGNESEQPMESYKNKKPLLTEDKKSNKKIDRKNQITMERIELYDKALMINEEFDSMLRNLTKIKND